MFHLFSLFCCLLLFLFCQFFSCLFFFFFFQAEDGIRDTSVTGVQTCALPIFVGRFRGRVRRVRLAQARSRRNAVLLGAGEGASRGSHLPARVHRASLDDVLDQIGRASCRERV